MEKLPENMEEVLGKVFADRNIPRVAFENDTATGDKIEVINQEGEIFTRIMKPDSTIIYKVNGEEL